MIATRPRVMRGNICETASKLVGIAAKWPPRGFAVYCH
jgi:hypothetical protein